MNGLKRVLSHWKRLDEGSMVMIFSKISAVIITAGIILAGPLQADHRDYLFEQGNKAYQENDYRAAVQSYFEILETGYAGAAVYYNLANSYYKLGENALAILNYERALRIKPSDEDIRFNLQIAQLSIIDKIPELPELFTVKMIRNFLELFSVKTLTILMLALYFVFMGAIILKLLSRSAAVTRIFKPIIFVLGICLLLFTITFISKAVSQKKAAEAVILAVQADARSAPSEDGTVIFTIHAGLKVKLIQRRGSWQEIRLPDGKQGWLPADTLERI